jgi:hypothetical protein
MSLKVRIDNHGAGQFSVTMQLWLKPDMITYDLSGGALTCGELTNTARLEYVHSTSTNIFREVA